MINKKQVILIGFILAGLFLTFSMVNAHPGHGEHYQPEEVTSSEKVESSTQSPISSSSNNMDPGSYKKSSVDSSPNKNYQSGPNNQKDSNNYAFEKTASDNEKTDDENISQTNTSSVNNMSNTVQEHQNTLLTAENIFILFVIFILGFGIVILADKLRNR